MKRYKLHLYDEGQDFLWFVVEDGRVIDVGPFQAGLWIGKRATRTRFAPGDTIFLRDTGGAKLYSLRYPVVKVEILPWVAPSHAKCLALRDAAFTGGLLRTGEGYACESPEVPGNRYRSNTITALVADFMMTFRTKDCRQIVACTAAGYDALPWMYRVEKPILADGRTP